MKLLQVLYFLFIIFVLPPIRFFLVVFSDKFRSRLSFEKLNFHDEYARSFKLDELVADYAFEVSSEGEFQQVRSLVEKCLELKKRVEIVYCSESLEKNIDQFKQRYGTEQLRVYRLPLVSVSLLGIDNWVYYWISAKSFIMCRYDFFPELIFYGKFKAESFVLTAATLKNFKGGFWQKLAYKSFDFVLTTTSDDLEKFKNELGFSENDLFEHDFRVLQISKRIECHEKNLIDSMENFFELKNTIESVDFNKRIIFGSYWPSENGAFKDKAFIDKIKSKDFVVFLLPHLLGESHCKEIVSEIRTHSDIAVHIFHDHNGAGFFDKFNQDPGIIVVDERNVLIELYCLFAHAFVGGGHGRSVHSLLEPYLAGGHLYCGPKVHRSTEYDIVASKTPEQITLVPQISDLFKTIESKLDLEFSQSIRDNYIDNTKENFNLILNRLGVSI